MPTITKAHIVERLLEQNIFSKGESTQVSKRSLRLSNRPWNKEKKSSPPDLGNSVSTERISGGAGIRKQGSQFSCPHGKW
jgi:hypothetical protein